MHNIGFVINACCGIHSSLAPLHLRSLPGQPRHLVVANKAN